MNSMLDTERRAACSTLGYILAAVLIAECLAIMPAAL